MSDKCPRYAFLVNGGDHNALADWLDEQFAEIDAAVVLLDQRWREIEARLDDLEGRRQPARKRDIKPLPRCKACGTHDPRTGRTPDLSMVFVECGDCGARTGGYASIIDAEDVWRRMMS